MAEFILTCRGYNKKFFHDFQKHRLTAYTVYCSIPIKGQRLKIDKWYPLPTDENYEPKLTEKQMDEVWNYWKNKGAN